MAVVERQEQTHSASGDLPGLPASFQAHSSFLCALINKDQTTYSPKIVGGVHLEGLPVPEAQLALRSEKTSISQELYEGLCLQRPPPFFVQHSHRLLPADPSQPLLKAVGVCAINLQIRNRAVKHLISVVPHLQTPCLVGADLLVRLGVQLDTINQILWSQADPGNMLQSWRPDRMKSGQTVPHACQVAAENDVTIFPRTAGTPICLVIMKGQKIPGLQAFFQPLPIFTRLNLRVCGTPLLELDNRSTYLLVQNPTYAPIFVKTRQPLGMLIDRSFHDFELTVPVVGELPVSLTREEDLGGALLSGPTGMITVTCRGPLQDQPICGATLEPGGDLLVYALTAHPENLAQPQNSSPTTEEPYPGFEAEINQQLEKADALSTEAQREALRDLFHEFRPIFSRDSHDCGVTDLHTVRIPTDPQAPPTFVRQ